MEWIPVNVWQIPQNGVKGMHEPLSIPFLVQTSVYVVCREGVYCCELCLKLFHGQQLWSLKGVRHEISGLQVFFTNLFSPVSWVSYRVGAISDFYENSCRYSHLLRCQRHWRTAVHRRKWHGNIFSAGVVVTGDQLSPVSLIPYIKLFSGFWSIPWHRLLAFTFEYLCEFSWYTQGLGETDSWKNSEIENLLSGSL
jgi:hypothetical protein